MKSKTFTWSFNNPRSPRSRPHQKTMRPHKLTFTRRELLDLGKSALVIGAAFTIMSVGIQNLSAFIAGLGLFILTVGAGFLLHELAHKITAHRYGCHSEYYANNTMLVLALLVSFAGFVFAAPGAVRINGSLTTRQHGIISASGPLTNVVLSLLFLPLLLFTQGVLSLIGSIGFSINAWIALFNLIPVAPFDGKSILSWNKQAYAALIILAGGLFITSMLL